MKKLIMKVVRRKIVKGERKRRNLPALKFSLVNIFQGQKYVVNRP